MNTNIQAPDVDYHMATGWKKPGAAHALAYVISNRPYARNVFRLNEDGRYRITVPGIHIEVKPGNNGDIVLRTSFAHVYHQELRNVSNNIEALLRHYDTVKSLRGYRVVSVNLYSPRTDVRVMTGFAATCEWVLKGGPTILEPAVC